MFKSKLKLFFVTIEATLLILLTACATTQGLAQLQGVKLERVDSSSVHIAHIYLQRGKDGIVLRGELERRIPGFGIVPGYLSVELIGMDGKVLKRVYIDNFVQAVKSRKAKFSLLIPEQPVAGSTIRVTHYINQRNDTTNTCTLKLELQRYSSR